jgi:hypothetical protein
LVAVFICGITFYQDIYYNSVSNDQTLIQNRTRVGRTMRTRSELPDSLASRSENNEEKVTQLSGRRV